MEAYIVLDLWQISSQERFAQHQGGILQIYSVEDAQTVGDVGQSIPRNYAALDKRLAYHQASIIEMDGNLYDQVVSILIDARYNYIYVNPNLVDKCALNK